MTVLKRNSHSATASEAVVLDLSDLGAQARRLLANARAESKQIVDDARADAQCIRAEADERGYDEGKARGESDGRAQGAEDARRELMEQLKPRLDQLTESWQRALEHWEHTRSDMLLEAREDILTFAFELTTKIIGKAIARDPSLVQDQVAAALDLLNRPTVLNVVVHPDDEPLVQEVLPQLLQRIDGCDHAAIATDPSIARGGCIVRTAGGSVDATIDTQLQRIAESLLPDREVDRTQRTEDRKVKSEISGRSSYDSDAANGDDSS